MSVQSLSLKDLKAENVSQEFTSAGIHPWWLEEMDDGEIEDLKVHIRNLAQAKKLWAIGESGMDRLYPEFLEKQKELFLWHWNLAEEERLPLVIHNVRSGSDFLEMLKKKRPSTPWIFHDYRGNEDLMWDLLRLHPESYFSFGISIDNSPQIRELLTVIPVQNIFLETDNQKHLDIHEIYLRASEQLKMDLDFLKAQTWHNFKKLSL